MAVDIAAVLGSNARTRFADLIAPLSPDEFLSRYWTREAVLLRGPGRDFTPYCSWDAVNAILNAGDITFPVIKVSRRDSPIAPELFTRKAGDRQLVDGRSVVNLFREGASFGITGADSHWTPLRQIVDCFHDALLESIHTNVYCSPARTQGFQCHYDLHEVFVLQIDGAKRWKVFRPLADAPIESWNREAAEEILRTEPYIDRVLEKGAVLYVPRGHWHYAVAEDSNSLHVTVGVTCRKGIDFIDWLSGELAQDAVWRRNAPLIGAVQNGRPPRERIGSWGADLQRSLIGHLSDPKLFDRFLRDAIRSVQPLHAVDVLTQGSSNPLALETATFERPAGRPFAVVQSELGDVVVSVAGSDIELAGVNPALVTRIFETPSFTLADVLSWDPTVKIEDVSELLTALVQSGLLIAR